MDWYLVHTKPRQESTALSQLERQGYTCYLPYIQIERIRRKKVSIVSEPLFPRYLFIQLDASSGGQSWSPIRSTVGVSKLVQFGQHTAKVAPSLIDALKQREDMTAPKKIFQTGDIVTIIDGPFSGLEAIYQATNMEQRALILLEILSKQLTMQIDAANLIKSD